MKNKKHMMILLTLTILLTGIVSATDISNDTASTKTQETITATINDGSINAQTMVNTDKEIKNSNTEGNEKNTKRNTYTTTVTNYDELVKKINDVQKTNYSSYTINLDSGDYNATGNILLTNKKNLIINANNITLDGKNKYQFMEISEGSSLTLNNIILTKYGEAIINEGTLSISNSILNNNKVSYWGVISNYGNLTLTNTNLAQNTAYRGGAIFNEGSLAIINSTLNNNMAEFGGAVYNLNNLTIKNTNFIQNSAEEGGAIENEGSLSIFNSTLNNNTAVEYGGAIRNYGYENQIELKHCNFINNLPFILLEEDSKFNIKLCDDIISSGNVNIYLDNVYDGNYKINDNVIGWNKTLTYGEHELRLETINNNKIFNRIYYSDVNETTVNNYKELMNEINKFKQSINSHHIISLNKGDYNATGNISLTNGKNLIINANNITLDGQNKYQFMEISEGSSLTLNNIILTRYVAEYGGAIRNLGFLTVKNSSFNNNMAEEEGGSISNSNVLTISNSSFNNNTAIFGGAILSSYVLNISNSVFNNNTAYQGGAINIQHILNITNTYFTENTAKESGGAIYRYIYDYLFGISYCYFVNNIPFELIEEDSKFNIKLCDDIVPSDYVEIYLDNFYDGEYFLSNNYIEWNKQLTNGEHEIIILDNDNNIITNNVFINISNQHKNHFNKNYNQELSNKKIKQDNMNIKYKNYLNQVNKKLNSKNNSLTLKIGFNVSLSWLNDLFKQNFTNMKLLIYIDDVLVYNSTANDTSDILFTILEEYRGKHTLKVVSNGNVYTKYINFM